MAISYASISQGSRKIFVSLVTLVATLLLVLSPSAAQAETAWRYWSYWTVAEGTWQLAMTGAADIEAVDGSVQGWRYITAGLEVDQNFAPRVPANFEEICGTTAKSETTARVAVVIDFGDPSDYSQDVTIPEIITECVVVEQGSPSSLLLPGLVELREDAGLICGINGLPAVGCGEEIEISSDEPTLISEPVNEQTESLFDNPLYIAGITLAVAIFAFLGLKKRK